MAGLTLGCGRFIPRPAGGGEADMAARVAALEAYLVRLSEELELAVGGGGAATAWQGLAVGAAAVPVAVEHEEEESV